MDADRFDTGRYVVDAFSAEQLARSFGEFSATDIRELLDGELVPDAVRLLAHYRRKEDPYQQLKQFSLRAGLGFYRSREDRRSPDAEYDHYLHYLNVKDDEHHAKTGRWLPPEERERITRQFYAPAYRAEMNKLASDSGGGVRSKQRSTDDRLQREVA